MPLDTKKLNTNCTPEQNEKRPVAGGQPNAKRTILADLKGQCARRNLLVRMPDQRSRGATENSFPRSGVTVRSHDDQVRSYGFGLI